MEREEAIEYLQKKDKIRGPGLKQPKFNKKEEKEIEKVEKEGKIYGDPIAEVQW